MQTFLRLCQASLLVIEASGKDPKLEVRIQRVLANFYQLRAELLNLTEVTAFPTGRSPGCIDVLDIITQMCRSRWWPPNAAATLAMNAPTSKDRAR